MRQPAVVLSRQQLWRTVILWDRWNNGFQRRGGGLRFSPLINWGCHLLPMLPPAAIQKQVHFLHEAQCPSQPWDWGRLLQIFLTMKETHLPCNHSALEAESTQTPSSAEYHQDLPCCSSLQSYQQPRHTTGWIDIHKPHFGGRRIIWRNVIPLGYYPSEWTNKNNSFSGHKRLCMF